MEEMIIKCRQCGRETRNLNEQRCSCCGCDLNLYGERIIVGAPKPPNPPKPEPPKPTEQPISPPKPPKRSKQPKPPKQPKSGLRKRIATVAGICAAVLVVVCTVSAFGIHNYIGSGLSWDLKNGTLTISGSGSMTKKPTIPYANWLSEYPWESKRDKVTAIVIENGVKSISEAAFFSCNAETVTIADSVTTIYGNAFQRCEKLKSVTIPDSVTSIGWYAFLGCDSLTSVTLPENCTEIVSHMFAGCSALESITIPQCVTKIENSAFSGCDALTSVTIPQSVATIRQNAFKDCDSLTYVYYEGSQEDWENIEIDKTNSCLTDAQIHYAASEDELTVKMIALTGTPGVSESEGYENLFDGNAATKWCVESTEGAYVIMRFSVPVSMTAYSMTTANDTALYPGRNPTSWEIYGCNAAALQDDDWHKLSSAENDTNIPAENNVCVKYELKMPEGESMPEYNYYILKINATAGDSLMQLSEFSIEYDEEKAKRYLTGQSSKFEGLG